MLAYSPALRAEEGKEAKQGKDAKTRQGQPGRGAGRQERLDKLAKDLNLTADQKTKVEAVMKEQGEKMRGMRDLAPDERRAKGKTLREEMSKKMKEILTAEQFEKWGKMRSQGRPGGYGGQRRGPREGSGEKK